ncbi:hypothetical protein [Leptospira kanakyensis]|uniref:Secreted protein n=1 Tax=Leptospira kanakyensis TaxID=2484968 RepID=A0A6N4QFI7_9LEPT|nr:hypothetical protein [Leptospira kanakyensis]MCW7469580.1 hypothetical protein [Leptospira kanakyensis]MCW7480568.1 hypothetical protein [Leptospira kanakyensis]TGK50750.1 hypothetical protein EHQ11_13845 [Leptospira kanakyensis]TGK63649.1 hypothetical protein EHQ16_04175 [Leptospira kanakyensis]TGK69887.1 hypothetical protein EHQ18_14005 [Leptospira kanakyensis]
MIQNLTKILIIATITLVSIPVFAGAEAKMRSEVYIPIDPNKKKVGEECKSSDECQKHHECTNNGEKNVCTAPPPPKLPPGAVT